MASHYTYADIDKVPDGVRNQLQSDLIGRRLGPFEILEFRGYEGLVEVYSGQDTQQRVPVEIRLAGRAMEADPVFNTRFRRDARAIAGIRHPNISRLLDFGQAEGGHYMVSEFVDGVSLAALMDEVLRGERILEPDDVAFVIRQVAAALDHAHKNGLAHLDLRPEDVVLTRSGQAIVKNFGVALLKSAGAADRVATATPYMAPEQLLDPRSAGPASDIYALGVILYQIATGELPYAADEDVDEALRQINDTAPDPRLLNEDVSASVAAVLMKALMRSPGQRFRSAMLMAATLERAYANPMLGELVLEAKKTKTAPEETPTRAAAATRQIVPKKVETPEERRERRKLEAELGRIKRAENWARFKTWWTGFRSVWGRTMAVLGILVLLGVAVLYLLQTLGVLQIALVLPTLPAPNADAADVTEAAVATDDPRTPTVEVTDAPIGDGEPTARPTATALQSAEGSPVAPIAFVPLEIGTNAYRIVDGQTMVFVPEGQFLMGTDVRVRGNNSKPQHVVTLSAYWIDRTEVTNDQYRLCVNSGICPVPENDIYFENPEYATFPVSFVSYEDSVAYCLWVSQQTGEVVGLPTEAQWEKAAGWDPITQTQRDYPWGNQQANTDLMRYNESRTNKPAAPVGSYPSGASAYGALDMAGNVWEWVADWFNDDYYRRTGVSLNPTGPLSGTTRVTRGGSWTRAPHLAITTVRNPVQPRTVSNEIGFRCAVSTSRPLAGSEIMLTPLELVAAFQLKLEAARNNPSVDGPTMDEWTQALDLLRQALEGVDHQTAIQLIAQRLDRIALQRQGALLDPTLALQLENGLRWIDQQLTHPTVTPIPTAGESPSPTVSPTP